MLHQVKQHNHYFKEKTMYDMTIALNRVLEMNANWRLCLFELNYTGEYYEAIGIYEEVVEVSLKRTISL